MFHPTLGRWLQEDPKAFSAEDVNFYIYGRNSPTNLRDPYGLEAKRKDAKDASARAKEFEKLLPTYLDKLKKAAEETSKLERFGVILKAAKPKVDPIYKFVEHKSKDTTETSSPFLWWSPDGKQYHGYLPAPDANGIVDLDLAGDKPKLDRNYKIEYAWHTHPPFPAGEAFPSDKDGEESVKNNIVGFQIQYNKATKEWCMNIIDTDGKYYEYKPPVKK